jgi:hydroxymethylpyrimidine pyrophosphatase-like HAD family hydrolase
VSYRDELTAIRGAFKTSLASFDDTTVARIRELLQGRTVTFVGSGGTLAIAELAAVAHRHTSGVMAEAATPLRFAESTVRSEVAVFFSARAKHPDTAFAIRHAIDAGVQVVLVTQRRPSELLPPLIHPRVLIATVPTSDRTDGFLATTSIAIMAGAVAQLYDSSRPALRARQSEPKAGKLSELRDKILVLHSEIGLPAARDLETRLHELGLASVQLTDYRNFGHGRHVGLARNLDTTTVIALIGPPATAIARRTISVLPPDADVRIIETSHPSVAGAISLLLRVIPAPHDLAERAGVEPSKPKVAPFGRKLYHLPSARVLPSPPAGPVQQKLAAAGLRTGAGEVREFYADEFARWRGAIQRQAFGGVLLDYDGTCVTTVGRFGLPEPAFRAAMIHALDVGLRVGFASGRGKSLYNDLREWLPERYWPAVHLALYNGTWFQPLHERLMKPKVSALTVEVRDALAPLRAAGVVVLEASGAQLSLASTAPGMTSTALRALVQSRLTSEQLERVHVVSSAHSVDIIPSSGGKRAAMEHLEVEWGPLYVIGDQGQPGGNDHDLLDSRQWTMTVDRCSARTDRCWPVNLASDTGPAGLSKILLGSHRTTDGVRLRLPKISTTR